MKNKKNKFIEQLLLEEIQIEVGEKSPDARSSVLRGKFRRTIDGKIICQGHPYLDIIINPYDKRVIALTKNGFGDDIYDYQNSLFQFLVKKGIIKPESVIAGNAFCSIEGEYGEPKGDVKVTHLILLNIQKWIRQQQDDIDLEQEYQEEQERELLTPDESTELDPALHDEEKGVQDSTFQIRKYLAGFNYFQ